MARTGKAKAAAKERASSIRKRDDAKERGDTKAAMKHGAAARKQGDIMRKESGREKGQRTTYTGPVKQATLTAIEKETGDVLSKTGTKWQQVNKAWQNELMKEQNLTRAQARSKLKTIFSNNRERFLTEQQRRYDANIVAPVLDTDIDLDLDLDDDSKTKVVPKITGGSEYLATDYDRPAFQDWSDLEPPNMPGLLGSAKAQQDLLGSGMAAYQPWAQPAIEYQPPVGPTYATRASLLGGADVSAAAAAAAEQQRLAAAAAAAEKERANQQLNNPLRVDPNQWTPPPINPAGMGYKPFQIDQGLLGGGQTPFMQFTQQAHESLYPDRFGTWGFDAQGNPLEAAPVRGAINILGATE
mgnify:CR=1 FL=1